MSLFSHDSAAPWALQVLTTGHVVTGTVVEDDQPPAGYFLRAMAIEAPLGASLCLSRPAVRSLGPPGAPQPPASATWTIGYRSSLVAVIPQDEASGTKALANAGDNPVPGATALIGPYSVTGTLQGSKPPSIATQYISFVMCDATVTALDPAVGFTPLTARVAVLYTQHLHGLIVP